MNACPQCKQSAFWHLVQQTPTHNTWECGHCKMRVSREIIEDKKQALAIERVMLISLLVCIILAILMVVFWNDAGAQVGNPALYADPGRLRVEWYEKDELLTNWYVETCLQKIGTTSAPSCFLFPTGNVILRQDQVYFWYEYCQPAPNGWLVVSSSLIEKIGSREIGVFVFPGTIYHPFCNHARLPLVEN